MHASQVRYAIRVNRAHKPNFVSPALKPTKDSAVFKDGCGGQ